MSKGSSYEREVCRKLSKWWSNGKHDDLFWRTPNSGGLATVRYQTNKKSDIFIGDVQAVKPAGKKFTSMFSIELKRGYNSDVLFDLLSNNPKKPIFQHIEQCQRQCDQARIHHWLLFWKQDRKSELVITNYTKINPFVKNHSTILFSSGIFGHHLNYNILVCESSSFLTDTVRTYLLECKGHIT